MINGLKPYPAYKDSGVLWLGKVPEHWEVRRLAASVIACINGIWGSDPDGYYDLPCVRVADFDRGRRRVRMLNPTVRSIPPEDRAHRILYHGDLLLEKSGGGDEQPVGMVVLYDHQVEAVCSNFIARMPVSKGYNPFFLNYLHAALYAIQLNVRSIKQTTGIQNLDSKAYLSELIAFPPLPEQTAIVRFLDYMDRRIWRYIRSKQKIIKLLEEYKQALIHQAVTGQIDVRTGKPYPAYKDSGVPWLGKVPEHWEVLPGRTVFREINDRGHPDEQMLSVTITRGVLRQSDLLADSSKKDSSNEDKSNYKLVQPGDLVYNKMRAWQGAVGVSDYRGIVSPAYIVQRLRSAKNLPRYIHYLLRTPLFASEAERWSYGITSDQWSLRAEEFKCIYFLLPPFPEQTAIVAYLDAQTARIDAAISATWREIELLREYRERLIADVVTGKVDVREVAGQLPEEPPEEPELIEEEIIEDDATDRDTDREGFVEEENES